ncbi:carboxymuconolactone decarboxylase family protein [Acidipropionibacterium jensenii]|uniref:carboxymuconolactone decarboxylase family protein n=1 Tax=Acidipropionibacterium jensenii TaxID=1749 RepID=UPI00214CF15F|nr:carboxymuconolactone decarboxylase family protein [Acidipropionibacterium jensenii]
MTTSETTIDILTRLDIDTAARAFSRALEALDAAARKGLDRASIEPGLRELVRLRASQLNGCAYCVAQDALSVGEPIGRIAAVAVWRESPFFTARERAALALTDTMTQLAETHVPDADWRGAAAHLNPSELGALIALVVAINAWNTVGVTTRAWTPAL